MSDRLQNVLNLRQFIHDSDVLTRLQNVLNLRQIIHDGDGLNLPALQPTTVIPISTKFLEEIAEYIAKLEKEITTITDSYDEGYDNGYYDGYTDRDSNNI